MKTYPLRLSPGQDLKQSLDALALQQGWPAACVLAAVGSLTHAAIRFADQPEPTLLEGRFEIVSLSGTLSPDGSHLHIAISDETGSTLGGHLKEGALIHTTAEIVLGVLEGWQFSRNPDPHTGYLELHIRRQEG